MYKYFCRFGKCFGDDGVEVMRYSVTLPEFEDMERITGFYRSVADRVVEYCENELKSYAVGEYERSELPKKRLMYKAIRYLLEGRVTHEDGDVVFVRLCASLIKGSEGENARSYDAHAWSVWEQKLLPPMQAARIYIPHGKLPREIRKADGIYLSDGKLFACKGSKISELEPKVES